MKLVTKISLGAALVLLLFSQIFSWWSLSESQKSIMESTKSYERKKMEQSLRSFSKERSSKERLINTSFSKVFWKNIFRSSFDMNAALYIDGEAVYNKTPYEFDEEAVRTIWETEGNKARGLDGVSQYEEKIQGQHLLLSIGQESHNGRELWMFYFKDITEVYQKTNALFLQGFGMALVLILCMLLPLHLIVSRILQPFYELKKAANVIAQGNYKRRVPVSAKDEIGSLSESFNLMAESVESHVEQLSRTNDSQQMLLGSLAHELKTPMMAIGGYAESLQRLPMTREQRGKSLNYIESECRRLSRLSAKMLELTGMYQADGQMEKEEISLNEFFSLADALAYRRIGKKNIHLDILVEPEDLTCVGDRDMLMSMLLNLIDNGCKASDEGGKILLSADELGIYVRDYGLGIPKEEVEKVMQAFYMVDKSRSRREGGAGLGLAICSQIAKAHGARLLIESQVGEGTLISLLWGDESV